MDAALLATLVGMALGIVLYAYVPLGISGCVFLLLVGVILLLGYAKRKQTVLLLAGLCLLGSAVGEVRMLFVPTHLPDSFVPLLDTSIEQTGVVVADPDLREQTQRLTIAVKNEQQSTRILAVAPLFPSVQYGDTVRVEGVLEAPEAFSSDEGRIFRYDHFLAKDGVFAIVHDAHIAVLANREGVLLSILGFFSDLKRYGIQALSVALPEPSASLAAGLILGGKQGLGESLLNDFIRSGLVHIVVLSGYNVMIVAEFILRLFGFLSRKKAAGLAALTIAGFVLAAGAGAASVRAGVMACVALFARATGRTYDALRALVFAGALMVLWNPLSLVYDPGFQLSFIATLGLIFGSPLLASRLAFIRSDFLREIVASTIAAQVAVLPLLLYQNGLFSIIALPANLLVLPMVPLAMLASAVAGVAGAFLPLAAPVLALPAYGLLTYIINVVTIASSLPLAALSVPAFPLWVVVVSYAFMGAYVYRASVRRASTTAQFTFSKNAST